MVVSKYYQILPIFILYYIDYIYYALEKLVSWLSVRIFYFRKKKNLVGSLR